MGLRKYIKNYCYKYNFLPYSFYLVLLYLFSLWTTGRNIGEEETEQLANNPGGYLLSLTRSKKFTDHD